MALNFPAGASMVLVSTNTVAKTILLPNPDPGRFLYIVDSTGNANTNNIYGHTPYNPDWHRSQIDFE
jgi:hypothetical protein